MNDISKAHDSLNEVETPKDSLNSTESQKSFDSQKAKANLLEAMKLNLLRAKENKKDNKMPTQ
jgi:hypothetical protein